MTISLTSRAQRTGLILGGGFLLATLAGGCDSCKKKPSDNGSKIDKPKDTPKVKTADEVPAPADMVGEIALKDPEAVAKRVIDGAGFAAEVPGSPWDKLVSLVPDANAGKALRAIDSHAGIAAAFTFKFAPGEKFHVIAAAKLKDAELANMALGAASKGGELKSWDSKVLEGPVYEVPGSAQFAVYGELILFADARDSLEAAGKYVAFKATKAGALTHDLTFHVATDSMGPVLQKLGTQGWASVATAVPPSIKTDLDPMVAPFLQGVADMGALDATTDIDGKVAKIDSKMAAKGTFGTWLGAYPVGDANALLSAPKGDSASLLRYPDGLGKLIIDGVMLTFLRSSPGGAAGTLPPEVSDALKQVEILGKAMGHELVMTNKGSGPSQEMFMRFDLGDPAAAKGAMSTLEKMGLKALEGASKGASTKPPAPKVTPYKKFGAEGEEVEITAGGAGIGGMTFHLFWAVRGSYLYLAYATGSFTLLDAGIDPASTATVGNDATAKAKIASFPTKGVISASYGDNWSFSGLGMLGLGGSAPPKAAGPGVPLWSYSVVDSTSSSGKAEIPLTFIGDLGRFYYNLLMMMGSPPPPY